MADVPSNLLFISTYTGMGGGETIQLNLMRALDTRRYSLYLLTPRSGGFPDSAARLGVKTHIIPYRGTSTFFVPGLWAHFPIVGRLRDYLRQQKIKVIVSDYHSLPFIVPAADSFNIPVIWLSMGWWFPVYPWQRTFFRHRLKRIVSISAAIRDKTAGIPPECIEPQIPGVDLAINHPDIDGSPVRAKIGIGKGVPLVALVARFQDVKGHEYFLEAARRILKEIPDARFAVAGENVFAVSKDESYKRHILHMAQDDPLLRERVTYLGFWPGSEVIAASDVMVCSSWFESLGMVALESMAMERPIVSTNVGGPSETIRHGVTGYLVPPRDGKAIADRVVQLLRDPALRQQMGKAGREHVAQNFSAERYAQAISAILDQAVEEGQQR